MRFDQLVSRVQNKGLVTQTVIAHTNVIITLNVITFDINVINSLMRNVITQNVITFTMIERSRNNIITISSSFIGVYC